MRYREWSLAPVAPMLVLWLHVLAIVLSFRVCAKIFTFNASSIQRQVSGWRDHMIILCSFNTVSRKQWVMVDTAKDWVYLIDVEKFYSFPAGYSFGWTAFFLKPQRCQTLACLGTLHINAKPFGCLPFLSLHAALLDTRFESRAMPPELLPSNTSFESACYTITANGIRKLQQQRLRVFTTIKRTAATTIILQMFYNPYCKSIEDFLFVFPQKRGARIMEVYCNIGELAWNVPEEPSAAPQNMLRTYRLRSTIQPKQRLMVRTTTKEKVEYFSQIGAYGWTLPKFMAPPYSSSLPLAYDELSVEIKVNLKKGWSISAIGSPSHGTVASNAGWIRMVKDERVDHKAFASFRAKDPQLKKDIVFVVLAKKRHPRSARRSPSPLSLDRRNRDLNQPETSTEAGGLGRRILNDGDQNESTTHQTSHSHGSNSSRNPSSAADWLTPCSPPSTPESNLTRCSAPSPESPDPDILSNNVRRLLALQHPSDCFNGHKTGFWTFHGTLPALLSVSASTLDSYPDRLKSRVWVTIVVIAWFEITAQDHVHLWLESVQRARKWLQFVRATRAVKFGGWEIEATNILMSKEDMDDKGTVVG